MKLKKFNNAPARKFQDGGAMAAPEAAPVEEGMPVEEAMPAEGQDQAMEQIAQMAMEIVQQLGPDAAAMLAQAIMEILQGGGAQQPMFRKGGKLIRR